MNFTFTTIKGDKKGEAVLAVIKNLGYKTKIIRSDRELDFDCISFFTPKMDVGLPLTESRLDTKGKFFCTSLTKTNAETPTWAKRGLARIAVKTVPKAPKGKKKIIARVKASKNINETVKSKNNYEHFVRSLLSILNSIAPWYPEFKNASMPWMGKVKNEPAVKVLSRRAERDKTNAKLIRSRLKDTGGYYVRLPEKMLQVSPSFFEISPEEMELVSKNGELIWEFWEAAEKLYLKSIERKNSKLSWVASSVEGSLTDSEVALQREVAKKTAGIYPIFSRADLSSMWFMVEIQERIGGMGMVNSWTTAIRETLGTSGLIGEPKGFGYAFALAVKKVIKKKRPVVVLICPLGYEASQNYFANKINEHGLDAHVVSTQGLENLIKKEDGIYLRDYDLKVDLIYRREMNISTLSKTAIGKSIIDANINSQVRIEPPLNMIYDCKSPTTWPKDPRTSEWFSSRVSKLLPPAALLPKDIKEAFTLGEETLNFKDITNGDYVVKYAGSDIVIGLGGRSVFSTWHSPKIVKMVKKQIQKGEPWLIQPMDRSREYIEVLDGDRVVKRKMANRIMVHYSKVLKSKKAKPILACVTSRTHWKAIGAVDAVFQEMRVRRV